MKFSDEMLLAYVDNELDEATRAEVDAAIAADPALLLRSSSSGRCASCWARLRPGARRAGRRDACPPPRRPAGRRRRPGQRAQEAPCRGGTRHAVGLARLGRHGGVPAGGAVAGRLLPLPGDDVTTSGGQVVARGDLARALSTELAATQPAVRRCVLATSYLSRAGEYCRGFTLARSGAARASHAGRATSGRCVRSCRSGRSPRAASCAWPHRRCRRRSCG
jgi:anti-sigma factor RsiW